MIIKTTAYINKLHPNNNRPKNKQTNKNKINKQANRNPNFICSRKNIHTYVHVCIKLKCVITQWRQTGQSVGK